MRTCYSSLARALDPCRTRPGHGLQPCDALTDRWMRAEQLQQASARERVHDEEGRRRRVDLQWVQPGTPLQLAQRARQRQWLAAQPCACRICGVLTGTGDGQLDQ